VHEGRHPHLVDAKSDRLGEAEPVVSFLPFSESRKLLTSAGVSSVDPGIVTVYFIVKRSPKTLPLQHSDISIHPRRGWTPELKLRATALRACKCNKLIVVRSEHVSGDLPDVRMLS